MPEVLGESSSLGKQPTHIKKISGCVALEPGLWLYKKKRKLTSKAGRRRVPRGSSFEWERGILQRALISGGRRAEEKVKERAQTIHALEEELIQFEPRDYARGVQGRSTGEGSSDQKRPLVKAKHASTCPDRRI